MVSHTATTRVVKSPSKPTKSITFQNSLARERERQREGDRERERFITELAGKGRGQQREAILWK